jgi:hypothetical protein
MAEMKVGLIGGLEPGFEAAVEKELRALRDDPQRVELNIDKVHAFMLIGQLQFALRHPQNNGPTATMARGLAGAIEKALELEPGSALHRLTEEGWEKAAGSCQRGIVLPH